MDLLKTISLFSLLFVFALAESQNKLVNAFGKSYELEHEGKFSEAASVLEAVNEKENGYEIHLRLGWLTYRAGDFSGSEAYYRKALSIRPYCIEARLGLVFPLSANNQWDEIVKIYNEILEIDPQNTLVNYRMGVIFYERGEFEKADAYLKKVVNLYPFDHDSLLMLAWTKFRMGQMSEAKMLFNKVLLYNPEDASALEGLKLMKGDG